jgi:predicted transcriptional regulator
MATDTPSAKSLLVNTVNGETMTTKDKAISVINSLSDDATLDDVIDRLYLLRKVELGVAQADAGDVMEHDEFMAELESENAG